MRVLQVINSLTTGGAEKLLVDSIIAYRNSGLDVDVLLLKKSSSPFYRDLKMSCPEITIHFVGEGTNVYNPLIIFKLKKYLNDYDIIHVHLFPSMYWVSLAKVFRLTRKPIIFTEHSTNNKRRGNKLFRLIDRIVYKQFEQIVTISYSAQKKLEEHLGKYYNNISTIENGVDLKAISSAKAYNKVDLGISEDSYLLIQVSSFRYPKDQKTVIRAVKLLTQEMKINLLLVGDGPTKNENIELAAELGISDQVKFLGIRSDVAKLLKSSDVIILSSHYEGLSLSSVEGMASGKPFIATKVPGLTDVVKNAGILFQIENEKALVEEVKKLKMDSEYNQKIVDNCIRRAKNYDINNMVQNYLALFKRVFRPN